MVRGVKHGQPPVDDPRRGEITYSGSSLECGGQIWSTGRHFFRYCKWNSSRKLGTPTSRAGAQTKC